ncbi:hypothetical protein IGI04_034907 [Brassica rapa subsp. trilocularis]|uniref:Uncharacterized protein n=1 Tax=Brassica rapa subsp. trilocularis TaxID=1813537 RepID=A0ABQ7LA45_BRACM|nr:hypothetical protein IGI04_034907 [Brassica rapa subsp. trilocularis]
MVSQSNAAGSSGRRRRANTPKAKPVSRSKKTKRYPDGIYERLDQFVKTLCDHFGVPLPNIHNKGKRKVGEDDHGYSGSPKSVENQYKKHRPNRKSRNVNSTVPKPGQEMHSYPLRSADGLEGTIGNTQPGFGRETHEKNENSAICEFNPKDASTASTYLIKKSSTLTIQEIAAIKKKTFPYSFAANARVSELQEMLKSIGEGQRRVYLEQRRYLSARVDHLTEHIICLPPHFKPHHECMLRVYKTELGKRTPLGGDDGASSSGN